MGLNIQNIKLVRVPHQIIESSTIGQNNSISVRGEERRKMMCVIGTRRFFTRMKNVRQCNDQCWALQPAGWCPVWQKLKCFDIFGHYKCDICETLHYGTAHLALPVLTTFGDHDQISRSQECQTVLTEHFMILRLSSCTSGRSWVYHLFWQVHVFKGDNW